MPENIVEAKGLVKTYKRSDGTEVHAVRGVDLNIQRGEIFSLLGPNGAGKTTTISMISGLVTPTAGDARIGGHSITREAMQAKRLLGVVPQEIALYPTLTAQQNLAFFGRLYGLDGAELNKRIDEVLEFIDLRDRRKDKVETFSGGMKRRVNIGVGLLHHPQLVYMDEPTVGVDPQSRRRILDTVLRLREEYGMTVLYTTHLMEEAQELSDRVGIMDHGQIIALGSQVELMAQIGEEDRLQLTVDHENVPPAFMEALKTRVDGIVDAIVAPKSDEQVDRPETKVVVAAKRGRRALPEIINLANSMQLGVSSVEVREPDLETLFLKMTGRALRD